MHIPFMNDSLCVCSLHQVSAQRASVLPICLLRFVLPNSLSALPRFWNCRQKSRIPSGISLLLYRGFVWPRRKKFCIFISRIFICHKINLTLDDTYILIYFTLEWYQLQQQSGYSDAIGFSPTTYRVEKNGLQKITKQDPGRAGLTR